MRNSWTDLTMYLLPTELPRFCAHTDTVSYSLPGYLTEDGHGFSLHFVPAHLQSLRALVQALETLAAQPDAQAEAEVTKARESLQRLMPKPSTGAS